MEIRELLEATEKSEDGKVTVVTKGGKLCEVEHDAVVSRLRGDADPYIYGWPLKDYPRHVKKRPLWFYVKNIKLAEVGDQVDI